MYPECGEADWVPGPEYSALMTYVHTSRNRPIKLDRNVHQRFILEDLFAQLAARVCDLHLRLRPAHARPNNGAS